MDWEAWLRKAAARPSNHEDSKREKTEKEVKVALAASDALKGRPYRVYVKGSYANNTNVRLNYDVDVAVEYYGYFYFDLVFDLEGHPKSDVGVVPSDDPYSRDEFKRDIKDALVTAFGSAAVETGSIAYRVRKKMTTLPADVVPCWEYRRYDRITAGVASFQQGSCVYPTGESRKANYPQQQYDNGVTKNEATGRRYKRMTRVLKRLQTRLLDAGVELDSIASYHVECIVYNVPDDHFNHLTYKADLRAVLAFMFNQTLADGNWNDWKEVNGLKYLFRGGGGPTRAQVHAFASAAWDKVGFE